MDSETRRINYLKHILSRSRTELIRKVFEAQKNEPTSGDFVTSVKKDLEKFALSEEIIEKII